MSGERTASLGETRYPARAAGLDFARPPGGDAVVLWEAEWRDADGELIDREVSIASTGDDWSPLLDLAPATIEVAFAIDDEHWAVHLRHVAGPVAIAPNLHDARPVDARGRPLIDVDPRPLLPRESRRIPVRWRDDDPAERRLVVDAWNAPGILLTPHGGTS